MAGACMITFWLLLSACPALALRLLIPQQLSIDDRRQLCAVIWSMKQIQESRMFRHRGWVGVICLVPVAICVMLTKPLVEEETALDFMLESIGWVLFISYAVFRIWATLFVGGRKDAVLQTEGPYSITRNPLYFGSFCFAFSLGFFFDSVMLVAVTLLGTIVYVGWIVRAEERLLEERFGGDFLRYKQE